MTQAHGPLRGVKVIELAGIGPGPFAAMLLAELGAEVIGVDRPSHGAGDLPARFDLLRRGRPSVELALRTPEGLASAREIVKLADVLIEGNRPGVTERLGLGPDCVAPVLSLTEARDHPHLRARATYTAVAGIPEPAPAPRLSRSPAAIRDLPGAAPVSVEEALAAWRG